MNYNVFAIPNGRMRGIIVSVLACGRLCVQYSVGTNTIHQLLFYDCLLRSKSITCWFRITYLSCNCVRFFSTNKGVKYTSVLFSHGPNKAFLVPDSCRTIKTVTV
jgi:hypothetical protein